MAPLRHSGGRTDPGLHHQRDFTALHQMRGRGQSLRTGPNNHHRQTQNL